MSNTIAKNTAYMTIASVGQKVLSFFYFTLIARTIGAEGTGKYFLALSFTTIFVVFIDLGFTNVFVREAAKLKEKLQDYLSVVIWMKLVLSAFVYIVAMVVAYALGYDAELRAMIYLSGVTMIFDSLHSTMYGSLRALGQLKYEALSITVSQLLTLILGSIFLLNGLPLIYLILAFTIPSVLNVLYVGTVLVKKYQVRLIPKYDKATFLFLLKIAIPFALAAIFSRVYSYVDSILLSKLIDEAAVGFYSIPYKISFAFQFIPLALVATLYPRFSEYFAHDKERLAFVFERGMKYLMLISFPVAVGIGVLAKPLVLFLYTAEYTPSILPLQILIASLIFSYLSFPIGAFLNACNKQVTQTVIIGVVMVINIILNLALIPHFGIVGAAISAFVGNLLITVFGYLVVPKITKVSHSFLGKTLLQVAVSASGMGGLVWFVNDISNIAFAIAIGIVSYPAFLFLFRAVTLQQLREAKAILRR